MAAKGRKPGSPPRVTPPSKPRTPATTTSREVPHTTLSARAQWQLAFGFRDAVDLLYEAHPPPQKPRLPTDADGTRPWRDVVLPETVDELLGNASATAVLHGIQQGTHATKTNFIISGGEGCGKRSFLRLLKTTMTDAATESPCVFQIFNATLLPDREIVIKIDDATKKMDSEKTTPYLIVEHFEAVPIAIQQHHLLPLVAVCNAKNIYAILIVHPDASKLPDQLKQRAGLVHMVPLEAMHVRTKILQICVRQKIGYHREALEELLQMCHFDLLPCIAKLQHVFVSHQFVSLANFRKTIAIRRKSSLSTQAVQSATGSVPPPFPLSILALNEPLRRCKLCTLLPPCSHITLQHLHDRAERIRQYYPTREDEKPVKAVCPSYCQRGICANIQSIGRCRYAHPRGLHTIDTNALVKRCATHTLAFPCMHCDHIQQDKLELREEEIAVARIQKELAHAKRQLLDNENERYMFVREHAKSVKWGAVRREYEDKLAHLDSKLQSIQMLVEQQQEELMLRRQRIETLTENVSRGRSSGLGRGNARSREDASIQSA